ncbi:MAG: hypothetical protein AAGJ32_03205 [Pseudomonadota bacterium]
MKHHLMIAMGLLMAAIFCFRMAHAFVSPGFGLLEVYLLGGIFLSGVLLFSGLKERKRNRNTGRSDPSG